jgi:hypothetical protein
MRRLHRHVGFVPQADSCGAATSTKQILREPGDSLRIKGNAATDYAEPEMANVEKQSRLVSQRARIWGKYRCFESATDALLRDL